MFLAVPAVLLAEARARRVAALGLVLLALGAASLHVMPGAGPLAGLAERAVSLGMAREALAVDAGFLFGGLWLLAAAAVLAGYVVRDAMGWILLAAVIAATVLLRSLLGAPGAWATTLAAAGLIAVPYALARAATALGIGRRLRRAAKVIPAYSTVAAWPPRARHAAWVAAIATVGVALLPTLWLVVAAVCVAAVGAHVAARALGRVPRVPVLPLFAVPLVAVAWYLRALAGTADVPIGALADVPASTAAAVMLLPPLVLGCWGFLGLAPVTRWVPGPVMAPVGLFVLARIGVPALAEGIAHWQPLLWRLLAAALWWAAVTRRRDAAVAALGTLALCGAAPESGRAALLLVLGAAVALLGPRLLRGRLAPLARLGWAVAAAGAVLTLEVALRHEVVLTLVAVGAVAALIAAPPAPAE